MANVKIRIIVNTNKLKKQKQVVEYCSIIDNTKGTPKRLKNPRKHITEVDKAQTIEWSGLAKNPNVFDQVSIDSITYEDNNPGKGKIEKDLFGVPYLIGVNGVIYGTVIAKDFDSNDNPEVEETYIINFTVIKADGTSKSYCVDPKLKVNPE